MGKRTPPSIMAIKGSIKSPGSPGRDLPRICTPNTHLQEHRNDGGTEPWLMWYLRFWLAYRESSFSPLEGSFFMREINETKEKRRKLTGICGGKGGRRASVRATVRRRQKWQERGKYEPKNGREASLYKTLASMEHLRKPLPIGRIHQSRPSKQKDKRGL